jgi:hypothetical protein
MWDASLASNGLRAGMTARDEDIDVTHWSTQLPGERHKRDEPFVVGHRTGHVLKDRWPADSQCCRQPIAIDDCRQQFRVLELQKDLLDDPL